MSEELQAKLNFIEQELPKLMKQKMGNETIISCSAESKSHLDGFMSSIFTVQLTVHDDNAK